MANLHFFDTYTVEQLKALENIKEINVRKNPNTNKRFFTYGGKMGAVAQAGIPKKPIFSVVHGILDREPNAEELAYIGKTITDSEGKRHAHPKANGYFLLLHEEGEGGAPIEATF